MSKIIVLGCPGAGKTSFSKRLSNKLDISLYHLDKFFWISNDKHVSQEEFDLKVSELCQNQDWIMDGNYGRTVDNRLKNCETVIYLDYPLRVCLWGATERMLRNRGKSRDDIGEEYKEKFDKDVLKFILKYHRTDRKIMLEKLQKLPEKDVVILSSRKEAKNFLNKLS